MSINTSQIKIGGYYSAGKNCEQLRKVINIQKDATGRNRIIYVSKSITIPNRPFSPAATLSNPALDKTFSKACCTELNPSVIASLRNSNILLTGE